MLLLLYCTTILLIWGNIQISKWGDFVFTKAHKHHMIHWTKNTGNHHTSHPCIKVFQSLLFSVMLLLPLDFAIYKPFWVHIGEFYPCWCAVGRMLFEAFLPLWIPLPVSAWIKESSTAASTALMGFMLRLNSEICSSDTPYRPNLTELTHKVTEQCNRLNEYV